MIGTIVALAIASKMFFDTKFSSVSCHPSVSCAESSSAAFTSPLKTIPVPGWMRRLSAQARTAATKENPSIHLNVRNAILPVPVPDIEPVATITDAITSGTMDIWISRMNMSPMNFRFAAQSPTISPKINPATAAMAIWTAGLLRVFMHSPGSAAERGSHAPLLHKTSQAMACRLQEYQHGVTPAFPALSAVRMDCPCGGYADTPWPGSGGLGDAGFKRSRRQLHIDETARWFPSRQPR